MPRIPRTLFIENIRLAWDLARRDLSAKYRRSAMGWVWLILTPLCLLGIYSLVFGHFFGIEWKIPHLGGAVGVGFALPFFVGLSVYLVLSDVVNSSTVLFASKRTYVVKSPFPLWVIWLANLLRAAVHAGVALFLVLALALLQQRLTFFGLCWMAIGLVCCGVFVSGLSLLLAALGPFVGDVSEAFRLLLRVLFYATPITYPMTLVPQPYHDWMWLNPLTSMVELLREPIVFGQMLPLYVYGIVFASSLLLFGIALWVFQQVKGVISDVV
ncbi:MAG: ABC transporter permease [Nitrospira sp.]|nr:ABC transporter permease [Nitrospira sp.]MDH4368982.1 ABC transporter permease [Nitrospira sp.]MDH5347126.1 ABC transporter permease [Nitrospira sp.]MDH5496541.1 ABC transporter permease [Nitrospira sp.]MDH5726784.1 ABC transporter permease [Nitrospira sp.]